MSYHSYERLVEVIRSNAPLAKLEALAQEHVGANIHVLLCSDHTLVRMLFDGRTAVASDFCRLVRGTAEGARRCSACRWLMAVQACCHGSTEYSCHGGVWAAVAPVLVPKKPGDEFVVVASCGFGDVDRKRGWAGVKAYIEGLGLPDDVMEDAYYKLTVVADEKRSLVKAIVETAASITVQLVQAYLIDGKGAGVAGLQKQKWSEEELMETLKDAFRQAQSALSGMKATTGSAVVDVVKAVVAHNPALPFSTANVAKAARLSPNHFSALFARFGGQTFSEFLTLQRVRLAKDLLGDLTLTVNEVATRAGFRDPGYFSRRFKAITGTTPLEWRRALEHE